MLRLSHHRRHVALTGFGRLGPSQTYHGQARPHPSENFGHQSEYRTVAPAASSVSGRSGIHACILHIRPSESGGSRCYAPYPQIPCIESALCGGHTGQHHRRTTNRFNGSQARTIHHSSRSMLPSGRSIMQSGSSTAEWSEIVIQGASDEMAARTRGVETKLSFHEACAQLQVTTAETLDSTMPNRASYPLADSLFNLQSMDAGVRFLSAKAQVPLEPEVVVSLFKGSLSAAQKRAMSGTPQLWECSVKIDVPDVSTEHGIGRSTTKAVARQVAFKALLEGWISSGRFEPLYNRLKKQKQPKQKTKKAASGPIPVIQKQVKLASRALLQGQLLRRVRSRISNIGRIKSIFQHRPYTLMRQPCFLDLLVNLKSATVLTCYAVEQIFRWKSG
jgi:hypothetical protein